MSDTEQNVAGVGLPESNLDQSTIGSGPKAPEINNAPPEAPVDEAAVKAAEEAAATKKAEEDSAAAAKQDEIQAAEEAAAAEAEAIKKAEIEANEYPVYNNEYADAITSILKESNVSVEDAYEIFGAGGVNQTPDSVNLAKLTEKLGTAKATAVMQLVKTFWTESTSKVQTVVTAVMETVGGKENFEKIREWALAHAKADPEFSEALDEYRRMLEGGKTQATLAAKELQKAYNSDPKNRSLVVKMESGDGVTTTSQKGLTRAEYLAQVKDAYNKGDNAKVAELNRLRNAGRKAGI